MSIPPLDRNGDLPVGIHPASLDEVRLAFGESTFMRRVIFSRLERIADVARRTGHLVRLIVYGSFVTSKAEPQDVDVFLVFDDAFDASQCDRETGLLLDHAAADAHFGASVFWARRPIAFGGEQATAEFWQTKRDGSLHGIIEILDAAQ